MTTLGNVRDNSWKFEESIIKNMIMSRFQNCYLFFGHPVCTRRNNTHKFLLIFIRHGGHIKQKTCSLLIKVIYILNTHIHQSTLVQAYRHRHTHTHTHTHMQTPSRYVSKCPVCLYLQFSHPIISHTNLHNITHLKQ